MALQFERNVNLEEIESDALFGIEFFKHQTLLQKIIFWGCSIIAIMVFILTRLYWQLPEILSFLFVLLIGGTGFLFGANQCEYLTVAGYLKLIFFKPVKYINFKSTEDINNMKAEAEVVKEENARKQKLMAESAPEQQRRMLIMVIAIVLLTLVGYISILVYGDYRAQQNVHHTVGFILQEDCKMSSIPKEIL